MLPKAYYLPDALGHICYSIKSFSVMMFSELTENYGGEIMLQNAYNKYSALDHVCYSIKSLSVYMLADLTEG